MLLPLLEKMLCNTVSEANDAAVPVKCGPIMGPASDAEQMVEVSIPECKTTLPSTKEEALTTRERSWLSTSHTWKTDGETRDFTLPENIKGKVVSVEAPPGHLATRGDDYFLEDHTVRFYRPPKADNPGVLATLRGEPAQGYQESYPCRLTINLNVWAKTLEMADTLLIKSLKALLAAFVNIENLQSPPDESGVRLRLLNPVALPDSIKRSQVNQNSTPFYHTAAQVAVLGELELTIALGAEEAEDLIERIDSQIETIGTIEKPRKNG